MNHTTFAKRAAIAAAVASTLAACGGGGGGTAAVPPVTTPPASGATVILSGSAATGLAMANASVQIKCATGTGSATTNSSGAYQATLANAALPCVLKVTSEDGTINYHSVAAGTGGGTVVANITPLTNLVVAQASGQSPAAFFTGFSSAQSATLQAANLSSATAAVAAAMHASVDLGSLNPFTAPLVPATPGNPTGGNAYDQLLDQLNLALTGSGALLASDLAGDFISISKNTDAPGGWQLNAINSVGTPANGVYAFTFDGFMLSVANAWGTYAMGASPNLVLTSSGWVADFSTGGLFSQTGSSTVLLSGATPQKMALSFSQPASVNLSAIDSSLSGTVTLPTGSKVMSGSSTMAADRYKLNGGSGFGGVATLAAFRTQWSGQNFLTWNGGTFGNDNVNLRWAFDAGGVLKVERNNCSSNCTLANGSWQEQTVFGVTVMTLTLPAALDASNTSSGNASGLVAGEKFFYAVTPQGNNVQEGIFTASGTASGSGFTKYNRIAMNAILTYLSLPVVP